jgi:hypothetical protein
MTETASGQPASTPFVGNLHIIDPRDDTRLLCGLESDGKRYVRQDLFFLATCNGCKSEHKYRETAMH